VTTAFVSAARHPTPVLSIGNIAMGGRGKTPLVAHVSRQLVAAGERPAILSRGYGRRRRVDGVVIVSDGRDVRAGIDESGDEPLMLARALRGVIVLVSEQRAIARALAEHVLGATVVVLDDGFQHREVDRDVDLVAVAPEDLSDRRLPFGALREPVSALRRADAVIVDLGEAGEGRADRGGELIPAGIRSRLAALVPVGASGGRVYRMTRRLGAVTPLHEGRPAPASDAPVFAVAGISHPERFTAALAAAGWTVSGSLGFRDHHRYRARDVAHIVEAARGSGAAGILTTAKDAVRLAPLGPLPLPAGVAGLDVEVEPAEGFRVWLLERLARARETRARA
jgi:tetraacyldisaccharide 4'-kinase